MFCMIGKGVYVDYDGQPIDASSSSFPTHVPTQPKAAVYICELHRTPNIPPSSGQLIAAPLPPFLGGASPMRFRSFFFGGRGG